MSAPAQTYNSLTDDLRTYLERGNPADTTVYDQIPRLIMMGQLRLAKESKTLISTTALQSTMVAANDVIAKPANWRNLESFAIRLPDGTSRPVYCRHYSFCRYYWPDRTITADFSDTSIELYYADYDYQHWLIVPTPQAAYDFEVLCQEPTPISDVVQTNFFTQYAYDVLLHACLLEGWIFLKDTAKMQAEQTIYDRLLQGISFEQEERKSDESQGSND